MIYSPSNIPADAPAWLVQELRRLQDIGQAQVDSIRLKTLYASPKKVYEGLIVKADGVTWNPGSGAGFYGYKSGAWALLG